MRIIYFLLFLFLVPFHSPAQIPEIQWIRQFEASMGCGIDDVLMTEEYVFVAIQFQGDIQIEEHHLSSFGLFDLALLCFDRSGALIWVRQAGSDNIDNTSALDWSPDGHVIWTGLFWDKLLIDNTELIVTVRSRAIFVCSIEAENGEFTWGKVIQGEGLKEAPAIAIGAEGNVLIGGFFNVSLFVDELQVASVPGVSAYYLIFNRDGAVLNNFFSKGAGEAKLFAACMYDDRIFISGTYKDEVILNNDTITGPILDTDIFLAALYQDGQIEWIRTAKGLLDDTVVDLQINGQNELQLSGNFSGRLVFGNGLEMQSQGFASDIFIARYGLDGTALSALQISNPGNDVLESADENESGWVFSGTFDEEFNWQGDTIETPAGSRSGFVLHLSTGLDNTIFTEPAGSAGFLGNCISRTRDQQFATGISMDRATTFLDAEFQASGLYKGVLIVYKLESNAATDLISEDFRSKVFPNPARDHIRAEMEGLDHMVLMDLHGQILKQSDQAEMSLYGLANGPYILKLIRTDKFVRSVLILVQK